MACTGGLAVSSPLVASWRTPPPASPSALSASPSAQAESLTCSTRNLPCMAAFGSSIQLTRVSGSSSSSNSRWLQSLSQVSLARYTGTCQVAGLPGPVLGVFWGWGGSEICGRSCQLASFPTCSPRATKPAGLQELARWRAEEKPSLWDGNGERWQRRRAGEAPGGGGTAVRRKRGGSSSPGGYGAGETGGSRSGERGRGAPGGRRTRESERAGPRGRRGGYGYGYEYPRGGDDDDDYKRMKGDKEQQLAWGGLEGGVESLLSWAAYVKEMLQAVPWSWPMLLMGLPLVLGLTHPSWLMLVPLPLMLFPSLRESLQEALAPVSKAFAPLKETLAPIGEALPPALSETWRNLQGLSHRAARETCRPPSASPSPSSRSPYPPPLAPSHSSHSPTPSTSSATSYSPSPSPSSSYPYPLASSRSFSEAPPRGPRSPPSDDLYSPSGGRGTTPGSTARSSAPGGLYGPQDAGSATAGELYMPLEPPPSRPPTGRRASVDTGLPLPAHRGDQQKPPRGTLGGQIWSLPRGRAPPPQQSESTGQGFYEDAPPVRPTEQSMGAGFGSELTSGQVFEYQRMFEYLAREEQEGPKGQGFEFQGFERQGIEAQGTWANPASQGFREPTSGQGLRAPPGGEGVRVPRQAEVGDRKREGFRPRPLPSEQDRAYHYERSFSPSANPSPTPTSNPNPNPNVYNRDPPSPPSLPPLAMPPTPRPGPPAAAYPGSYLAPEPVSGSTSYPVSEPASEPASDPASRRVRYRGSNLANGKGAWAAARRLRPQTFSEPSQSPSPSFRQGSSPLRPPPPQPPSPPPPAPRQLVPMPPGMSMPPGTSVPPGTAADAPGSLRPSLPPRSSAYYSSSGAGASPSYAGEEAFEDDRWPSFPPPSSSSSPSLAASGGAAGEPAIAAAAIEREEQEAGREWGRAVGSQLAGAEPIARDDGWGGGAGETGAWGAPEGERYREGMPSAEASRSGGEGAGWRSGSGSASDFDSSSRSDPGSASASGYGSASASASASGFGSGSGYGSRFVSASASGSGYDSGYGSASGSGSYYTRGEGGGNGDGSIGVGAFDGEVYDSSRRWSVRAASTAGPLGAAAAGSVSRVPSGAGSMPSGTAGGMRDSVQRAPPLSFPDGRHQAAVDGAVEYSRSVPADGDLLGGRRAAQPQPLRHLGLPEVGQGVASWHRWEGGVASAERGEYVAKMSVSRRQLAQERRQQSRGLPKEGRLNSAPALDRGRVSAARSSSSAGGGDTSTGSTSSNSSRGGSSSSSSSGGGGRRGGQSQERGEAGEAGEAQEAQEEQEDWFYKPEFLQEPAGKSRLATPGRGGQGQGQVQGQGQGRRKRAVGGGDGGREGNSGESRVEFDTEGGGGGEEWFYRPEFLRKSAGGEGRGERTPGNASERPGVPGQRRGNLGGAEVGRGGEERGEGDGEDVYGGWGEVTEVGEWGPSTSSSADREREIRAQKGLGGALAAFLKSFGGQID